jgi:hypothetical protein
MRELEVQRRRVHVDSEHVMAFVDHGIRPPHDAFWNAADARHSEPYNLGPVPPPTRDRARNEQRQGDAEQKKPVTPSKS